MAQLHDLTALEQGAAIRARDISAVELAEHYVARSERLTGEVGAFVTLTPELALEQARAADARIADGVDDADPSVGPLFGVVCPVKDLNFVAGVRCRLGSLAYDIVPESDDNVVVALREAGLVFTGKTNTPEFGLPCYTEPDEAIAPAARTPWDLSRSAGGSSGGAAAAVAAGLAPVAHGSDGGGSIRIPASVTGLVGIKPSRGRISSGPLRDAVGDLLTSGPMARTVADAAALLDVMSRRFAGDPFGIERHNPGDFLAAAHAEPGRLRIGAYRDSVMAHVTPDDDVIEGFESTRDLLVELGHEVEEVPPPFGPEVVDSFTALWSVLSLLTPVPAESESLLMPLTAYLREQGRAVSGIQLAGVVSVMRLVSRAAMVANSGYDAILVPTVARPPAPVGGLRDDADPVQDFENQKLFAAYTATYNVTGQPSINVPVAWSADGLPIGMQLVGRHSEEATLISLAAQLERARPWAQRKPELW